MTPPRMPLRVLEVGKDARTDAITEACKASPQHPELFALAEIYIPGLVEKCQSVSIASLTDVAAAVRVARQIQPDLVIIGPEEPLEAGFTDALRSLGIPVFGPTQRLAAIESSKSWARRLMDRYEIPGNPDYRLFESDDGLRRYMEELGSFVVKPDGLTAGKGVRVFGEHLHSVDDAVAYAQSVLDQDGRVQIEDRLEGEEFSLQTITDGHTVIHCPPVQDHKRAFEEDRGPNTGGMGSYSCADFSLPFLRPDDVAEAQAINEQVIDALARETGELYCGVLYGGFMATRDGLRVIEFNSRFGDPEAMNVLPLLDADFVEICAAAARGELSQAPYSWRTKATVCKYVVPGAYPQSSPDRQRILVPNYDNTASDLRWYWAACEQVGDETFLTSSRSGAFVGLGATLDEAERVAEQAARELGSANSGILRHRSDVGRADVISRRVTHMRALRSGGPALLTARDV